MVSSVITEMIYFKDNQILVIEFTGKHLYAYAGVSEDEWRDLKKAPSKGAYVNKVIKPAHGDYQQGERA